MKQLGKNYLLRGENYPGSALALLINLKQNQQIKSRNRTAQFQ
jgi:hypothetical protein